MNVNLIVAIVWILIAIAFLCAGNLPIGFIWLLVGVINLVQGIRVFRRNKKLQTMMDLLDAKYAKKDDYDENIEEIDLSEEVHTIFHEYTGYGYVVNKSFKIAKSHAAEVDLLCTYAPKEDFGREGDIPYIAVQMDDEVYCAIEEYKENGTVEDVIYIEPLEGIFLFKAKKEYYGDIMYFYGFELENEEYWDKAGLCLVYPKEYVGTENEKKLMDVLDKAANSFKKNIGNV